MKLIAGLGNPGLQYKFTRHNIGFILLDTFADKYNIVLKEGRGEWWEGKCRIDDEEVYLMKPATFMNSSGTAVAEFKDYYNINTEDILIVVDDFQIPLGTIRFRKKGSDGGHNGLSSIIYNLNTDEFSRMRIGIGSAESLKKEEYIDFVLGNFDKEEIEIIQKIIPSYNQAILSFISDGITVAMNTYNRSFI